MRITKSNRYPHHQKHKSSLKPRTARTVSVVIIDVSLIIIVEVLVPRVVSVILGGTPIIVIGKTTHTVSYTHLTLPTSDLV